MEFDMEKLNENLSIRLDEPTRRAADLFARMEGFESSSAYIRHLVMSAIEAKRIEYKALDSIFGQDGELGNVNNVYSAAQRKRGET